MMSAIAFDCDNDHCVSTHGKTAQKAMNLDVAGNEFLNEPKRILFVLSMKAFRFNLIVLLVAFHCVFLPSIEAKELNKQAMEIKPMSVKALVKNGKEFLRKKDIETAQAYFEKALKINRSYFYFNRDDLTDTAIVRNLISIYKRKEEWKKAEELYEVYQPYASEN